MARNNYDQSRVWRGAVLNPYRMEDEDSSALKEKLSKQILPNRDSFFYVLGTHRVWASGLALLILTIAWFIPSPTPLSFFAPATVAWALWWTFFASYWPRSKKAERQLEELNDRSKYEYYGHDAAYVTFANVVDNLRCLPRDLRDAHRALFDGAEAAFKVLNLDPNDDEAWAVLEAAETTSTELTEAQAALYRAVAADKRAMELQVAKASLTPELAAAHEAAHAEAQAMLEGVRSMEAMTAHMISSKTEA